MIATCVPKCKRRNNGRSIHAIPLEWASAALVRTIASKSDLWEKGETHPDRSHGTSKSGSSAYVQDFKLALFATPISHRRIPIPALNLRRLVPEGTDNAKGALSVEDLLTPFALTCSAYTLSLFPAVGRPTIPDCTLAMCEPVTPLTTHPAPRGHNCPIHASCESSETSPSVLTQSFPASGSPWYPIRYFPKVIGTLPRISFAEVLVAPLPESPMVGDSPRVEVDEPGRGGAGTSHQRAIQSGTRQRRLPWSA
jgi:hypothetical protein